ncbi:MAG: DegV family protein [Desulfobulbaceae bacterium]|nr:MAG: DegV family protein [Desulfobulbaceae bacterium]
MEKIAILVDSACGPTPDFVNKYKIFTMGMKINLDRKVFIDGADLEKARFYEMIDRVKDFSTAPPQVWDIKKIYERIKRSGYDRVVSVHVSSKMSKLYEACDNACGLLGGVNVELIDTRNTSIGAYLVAEKIAELLHAGRTIEEINSFLPEIRRSSFLQISLSTLKYLIKNKRVGRVQGMVGSMLKVKPILGMDSDGYLSTLSKVRGGSRVADHLTDNAIEFVKQRPYNVKVYLTWGFDENRRQVERVRDKFIPRLEQLGIKNYTVREDRMWPTIACNSGPGAYGFAVYGEEHPIN